MTESDSTLNCSQTGQNLPQGSERKWTGLAKFLLVVNLVFGGLNVLVGPRQELIILLPTYVCVWGIYKFKRWGFYLLVAIRVLSISLLLFALGPIMIFEGADGDGFYECVSGIFSSVVGLIVVSLIVRSRWKDMDPVFRKKDIP